jgi:hypothetical protein
MAVRTKEEILFGLEDRSLVRVPLGRDDYFSHIHEKDTNVIIKGLICNHCDWISGSSKYSGHHTGHKRQCTASHSSGSRACPIPQVAKDACLKEIVSMCARDFQPFSIVHDQGFIDYTNFNLSLGYHYGFGMGKKNILSDPPSAEALLPHRTTVARHVKKSVQEQKPEFDTFISENIRKYGGAITVDMASKHQKFFGVSIHFFDKHWHLHSYCLDCSEFEGSANAVNLKAALILILQRHGMDESDLENLAIITDEGANMVASFQSLRHFRCMCHLLNTIAKRTLEPFEISTDIELDQDTLEVLSHIKELIQNLKRVVKGINARIDLKNKLKITLTKEGKTRWLSRVNQVKNFLKLSDEEITLIRNEISSVRQLKDLFELVVSQHDSLNDFITSMEPFNKAITVLEADKTPTSNLVLLEIHNLIQHLKSLNTDPHVSDVSKAITTSALQVLEYKLQNLNKDYHFTNALILDPHNKNKLRFIMSQEDFEDAISHFKESVLALVEDSPITNASQSADSSMDEDETFFGSDAISSQIVVSTRELIEAEIKAYFDLTKSAVSAYKSVVDFWRTNEVKFPTISKLARRIHPVPASSAPTERIFSRMNKVTSKERSSLNASTVTDLVCLKTLEQYKEFKELSEQS